MADDEFDDDIDWGSITLPPVPSAVTPSHKRQRLNGPPSLLDDLKVAPMYGTGILSGSGDTSEEDGGEEVGDALQLKAIKIANKGSNLFLTGKAGTGKSWVTKRIVKDFDNTGRAIHVTAPTGIAAINVGGSTIHSWGRFMLGEHYEDFDNMMSEDTRDKISSADALLIDEVSMLDGHLFDVLECMIAIIRYYGVVREKIPQIKEAASSGNVMSDTMLNLRWDTVSDLGLGDIPPFGGLQMIVVGDFYQLPPVPARCDLLMKNENMKESGYAFKVGRQGSYAFESHAWHHSYFETVELTEVHRQGKNDGLFEFLNDMREGKPRLETNHTRVLRALQTPLPERNDGIIPTELHAKNFKVDGVNLDELLKLPGGVHEFISLDDVNIDAEYIEKILDREGLHSIPHATAMSAAELINSGHLPQHVEDEIRNGLELLQNYSQQFYFEKECRVSHSIELKEDAQVMLLWNLDFKAQLANGSRGVVRGFFPSKEYFNLIEEEMRNQREDNHTNGIDDENDLHHDDPEMLGLPDEKEISSDGDLAVITPSKLPQETQNENTVKEEKHFDISGLDPDLVKEIKWHVANMGPAVREKEHQEMMKVIHSGVLELPYIQFANGKRRIIRPQPFTKEFKGVGTATRWQIPLTLAWAISIHKSQGMTIECLHVDLTDCFAIGQAYVACSRGKCLESMTVKNFKPSEIKTSKKVKHFYNSVHNQKPYTGPRWSDTIAAFDEEAKKSMAKMNVMKHHYSNVPCSKCGTKCIVHQIKTNRNNNQGKYFMSCPESKGERGHTWELLNTRVLNSPGPTSANVAVSQSSSFAFMTPGVDGAIAGRLDGMRAVTTGVFLELGGGSGLKLGKVRMREMIESFGGKVTGSISGKTNFVIVGDEPGEKRLEDAKSKGLPIISRSTLRNILIGEEDVPGEDGSQPSMKKILKTEAYDV